jgi:hypothetical protein
VFIKDDRERADREQKLAALAAPLRVHDDILT